MNELIRLIEMIISYPASTLSWDEMERLARFNGDNCSLLLSVVLTTSEISSECGRLFGFNDGISFSFGSFVDVTDTDWNNNGVSFSLTSKRYTKKSLWILLMIIDFTRCCIIWRTNTLYWTNWTK